MELLSRDGLKVLYSDFVRHRDEVCNGCSDISVKDFYDKNKSKYENVNLNQCDGCARGLLIVMGIHRESPSGLPYIRCSAGLYA